MPDETVLPRIWKNKPLPFGQMLEHWLKTPTKQPQELFLSLLIPTKFTLLHKNLTNLIMTIPMAFRLLWEKIPVYLQPFHPLVQP